MDLKDSREVDGQHDRHNVTADTWPPAKPIEVTTVESVTFPEHEGPALPTAPDAEFGVVKLTLPNLVDSVEVETVDAKGETEPVLVESVEDEVEEAPRVSLSMTKAELVAVAEDRGITVVPDTMTKADIIAAIEGE